MCRHTIVRSYCRYYGRCYSHHTLVITTVATNYHMTTHAIFFSHWQCRDQAPFKKKITCIFPFGNVIVVTKIVHHGALLCTIVVATIALPHDYWQDQQENCRLGRETHSFERFWRHERTPHMHSRGSCITAMASAQECAFVVVFGSLLFCARERGTDPRIVVVFEGIGPYMGKYMCFFFNSTQPGAPSVRKKITCVFIR